MKKNKSSAVMEMLKKGLSVKEIRNRISVSESYVYLAKKKLADMADEAITEAAAALKEACTFTPKPEPEVKAKEEELDAVLDARGDQYGVFMQNADTAIKIKGAMHNAIARNDMHLYPDQLQALDMIASKMSRIVNGNPNHTDSWIDIAGYAMLVADRIQGKAR